MGTCCLVRGNDKSLDIKPYRKKGSINDSLLDKGVEKNDWIDESVENLFTDTKRLKQEKNKQEDIYDYVSEKVKQLIEEKGKYIFKEQANDNLESRPLTI